MSEYILEMKNIRKEFLGGKIVANDDITLKVKKGEIHAIVGENGAGKSTLMKILNGLYSPTSGEIFYKGEKIDIESPTTAANLGIGMVYQHFMLVDTLTVAENMVLGFEPKKGGVFFDLNTARKKVREVSEKYGDDAIYKDGLKIYTTLDMDAQNAAVAAMQNLPDFDTDKNGLHQPQGAIVAMNPHNGYIVAMVGGRGDDAFNRATQAERQPGSTMKPFVYLAAIQSGKTPGSIVEDSPVTFGNWSPKNYENDYEGNITYRYALQHSRNVAAVKVADEVGMTKVINLAKEMGISTLTDQDYNLSTALGGLTHGVTPLDMVQAYGVLANGGIKVQPTAILKISPFLTLLEIPYNARSKKSISL